MVIHTLHIIWGRDQPEPTGWADPKIPSQLPHPKPSQARSPALQPKGWREALHRHGLPGERGLVADRRALEQQQVAGHLEPNRMGPDGRMGRAMGDIWLWLK